MSRREMVACGSVDRLWLRAQVCHSLGWILDCEQLIIITGSPWGSAGSTGLLLEPVEPVNTSNFSSAALMCSYACFYVHLQLSIHVLLKKIYSSSGQLFMVVL